ncbi:hypothetical protein ACQB60_18150 [Actinomycetota bacterium Odt1-20B]
MTDLSTEPVVAPTATPDPPPDPPPTSSSAPEPEPSGELAHAPGGYPVMPLALSGANTTAGLVGAGGLVGGPLGAAAAAGGLAVFGTVAAVVRARRLAAENREADPRTTTGRDTTKPDARKPTRPDTRQTGRTLPNQGRGTRAATGTTAGRNTAGASRTTSPRTRPTAPGRGATSRTSGGGRGTGQHRGPSGRGGSPKSLGGRSGPGGAHKAGGRSGAGRAGAGKLAQARALRAANKQQTPTRSAARQQAKDDRRAVADARRDAKAAAKQAKRDAHGGRGPLQRAAAWGGRKAASGARALLDKARARQDRKTDAALAAKRDAVRKAPARRKARWALRWSAVRLFGKRLLAGALAGALGLVGCLTSPLGRKLNIPWLIHPGRRLYRRLMAKAHAKRAERDWQIRATRAAEEAQADADAAGQSEIGDRVERPAHLVPHSYPTVSEVVNVSGFKFEEAASEMQNAAASYSPDGNMEVVDMIDNLPAALECVAKTFLILAERSDQEFAFEKEVADGFDDIYKTLLNAVDAAVDLGPRFREIHEHDIARHEDPRNGTEAEKGWNVT